MSGLIFELLGAYYAMITGTSATVAMAIVSP